jgi:hypothetical protein
MSILKSVLFGYEGSYTILGSQVRFKKELPSYLTPPSLEGAGVISRLALTCLNNNAFRWITQSYMHLFVHEMSHAITCKVLTGQNGNVDFFLDRNAGRTPYPQSFTNAVDWKKTVISIAGPMGNIAFSICKLVAATALKNYLAWPVRLALGGGAVFWISGELLYAYVSASNKDQGDFGSIACLGPTHLAIASIAIVSQCALGIFAAIRLAA